MRGLNLDFGAELDDLSGRHVEESCGAFGVTLQERKYGFAPHRHAGDLVTGDDGLAADVIGDVGEVDAGQLALFARQAQPVGNRRILHEAIMQDDARDAFDHFDDLGAIGIRDARHFGDLHGHQNDALMQNVVVLDELRQRQRHAVWRGCQEGRGAIEPRMAATDGRLDQVFFGLTQFGAGAFDQFDTTCLLYTSDAADDYSV